MTKISAHLLGLLLLLGTSLFAQNVGIGTITPTNKLSVNGKVNITDSLGVGTTTPASVLHLQSANVSDTSSGDIILSRYWNGNTDTRASSIFHYNNTGTNSDNLAFGVAGNGGSFLRPNALSQIKMVIQANGNVGIGTTTPTNKLSVNGTMDIREKLGIGTTNLPGELHVKSPANSTLDQQQTIANNGAGGLTNWQSFTAGITGLLTKIDLQVGSPNLDGSPSPGIIKIFNGVGNGGTLLSTTNVTFQEVNATFQSFKLSSYPSVIAGNIYTIEFSVPSITVGWVDQNDFNPYPGGRTNRSNINIDYLFKTYVSNQIADGLVVEDGKAKVANLQITNGASNGFVLKSDATGNASWVNSNTLPVTETDPKVGTLTSNKIPKWNGTILTDGLLFDNGTNVGIGTTTPANKLSVNGNSNITGNLGIGTTTPSNKLTVVQPFGIGFAELSGDASASTSIGIGRTSVEGTINVAAGAGQYAADAVAGDLIIRTESAANKLILNTSDGAAALTVNNRYIGIGTTTPSNKLTVVFPSGIGFAELSGDASEFTSIGIGRSGVEGTLNIAAGAGQFATDATAGDLILRTQNPGSRLILNNGGSAAVLTVTDGKVGVSTTTPQTELDVDGGIRTKYSGSEVVNLGVGTHTINITMPNAVPVSWNNSNTMPMVINGDGAEGFVRAAKITSTTNLQVRFQQDQAGFVRLNWVILKL